MAKNNNLSIVEQERRKKKAKELKKAKEQRNKEKLERLSQVDPKRLRRRVADLESRKAKNNGRLLINEQRQLESLQSELEYITRKNLVKEDDIIEPERETHEKEVKPIELGAKSIFWDPEWNPLGIAPKGQKNISYPLKSPHNYEIEPEVEAIPIPTSPPPRFFKIQQAQTTYESAPEVKVPSATTTRFIPSTVRNKVTQKESTNTKLNVDSDNDNDQDDMAEYASEEEEYLKKRKADELE